MICIQTGLNQLSKVIIAPKDLSPWLKEIDMSNLIRRKNLNQCILEIYIWLIQKIIFNTRSQIRKNKGKLFSKKILIKMLKFKGLSAQEDLKQITLIYNQFKIKLTSLIIHKSKKLNIVLIIHFLNKMERSIHQ